jgi:hypothetical protein
MVMDKFNNIEYDDVRLWIRKKRESTKKTYSWEEILLACKSTDLELMNFLESKVEDDDWPPMTIEDWKYIVYQQKVAEEETIRYGIESGAAIIHGEFQNNTVKISNNPSSSWQTYKKGLLDKGFKQEAVNEIERATLGILRRLSLDTTGTGPIKGLVVGNVQSGKTANMAALMAMSADCGWNMFIILSGTIENLRKQTENRLFGDLNKNCLISWEALDRPNSRVSKILKANAKRFDDRNKCYFTVCLKNKSRLQGLLDWLQEDSNTQSQMKVLVIDDEADQAGINTADVTSDEDRKVINDLIRNLVNGKDKNGNNPKGHFQAMNYIGYTATPYANVLNESGLETLYPKDFISTLSVSNEYFGPQQIFGCEDSGYEGIDIVRNISSEDIDIVANLHKDSNEQLPKSLKESICWFLCGVACLRYWDFKKPISMLVHTSQNTDHHKNVATAIENWINSKSIDEILCLCQQIWDNESSKFTLNDFLNQYPNYGIRPENLRDYPTFDSIKEELKCLLDNSQPANPRVSNIPLAEYSMPRYHNGVHLCIDNCRNNGTADGMMMRLMYPNSEQDKAPAFLVVGGATLSRGLTIEGLISTYFLRSVKQSDTLMQMGRWFGYRKGYELIPRIWLSQNTKTQFEFLSLLDQRLRDEIHYMDTFGISPSQYGPRVVNSPRLSWIRIVAKNRMQMAQDTDKDYSGASSQTQLFDNVLDTLLSNLNCTKKFLLTLGEPDVHKPINSHAENCVIWRNVTCDKIFAFLRKYSFQERQNAFRDIDSMIDWIKKMTDENLLDNWNVVLTGVSKDNSDSKLWKLNDNIGIYKVTRSQKSKNKVDGVLNIGALRVPKDIVSDIDLDLVSDTRVHNEVKHLKSKYAFELREKAGLSRTPQLLIYIIDKDSTPTKQTSDRCPLEAKDDVVGLSLTIPGESRYSNNTATLSIFINDLGIDNTQIDIDNAN